MILIVRYKQSYWRLNLEHKITRILGHSGMGKTTLAVACSKKTKGADVLVAKTDVKYSVVSIYDIEDSADRLRDVINSSKNKVFIIDEDSHGLLIDTGVQRAVRENKSCYFIIIGRHDLPGYNIDIDACGVVKTFEGAMVLEKLERPHSKVSTDTVFTNCIIEDSGRAFDWFKSLFEKCNISIETSGGKDTIIKKTGDLLRSNEKAKVLMIFDRISLGSQAYGYSSLIEAYGNRLFILSHYLSWEHLILKSNMFKDKFKAYDISTGMYEEKYYEELLSELSKSSHGRLQHDSTKGKKLPLCYTEPCCAVREKLSNKVECTFGVANEHNDKFVDMLIGTEFQDLLIIAKRLEA